MSIAHHLDDSTLMSLSAGALPEALAVVASCHLEQCDHCRSRLSEMDMLGGAMLEKVEPVPLSEGMSERMAAFFDSDNVRSFPARRPRTRRGDVASKGELPASLTNIVGPSLDNLRWHWLAPGIRHHLVDLPGNSRGTLRLLRIKAGMRIPEHGHCGSELTLVLRGAYHDRFGRFTPGDVADLDDDAEHEPRVDPGEECICLVATEQMVRFKGILSRVLQPLTGM